MRSALDSTIYGNAVYRKRHFGNDGFKSVWRWRIRTISKLRVTPTTWGWVAAEFWGIAASTGNQQRVLSRRFLEGPNSEIQ